jgi:hypothetical protein
LTDRLKTRQPLVLAVWSIEEGFGRQTVTGQKWCW